MSSSRHDLDARDDGAGDRFLRASTSRSTPSMRKRTTRRFSNGSMWMSRRAFLDRFGQQRIDQADDRRVVFGFEQIFGFRQFVGEGLEVEVVVEVRDHRARIVALLVERAQQTFVARRIMPRQMQRRAEIAAQFGQHFGFHAVAIGDFGDIVTPADQGRAVAPREAEARAWRMLRHRSWMFDLEAGVCRRARRRAAGWRGSRARPAASACRRAA